MVHMEGTIRPSSSCSTVSHRSCLTLTQSILSDMGDHQGAQATLSHRAEICAALQQHIDNSGPDSRLRDQTYTSFTEAFDFISDLHSHYSQPAHWQPYHQALVTDFSKDQLNTVSELAYAMASTMDLHLQAKAGIVEEWMEEDEVGIDTPVLTQPFTWAFEIVMTAWDISEGREPTGSEKRRWDEFCARATSPPGEHSGNLSSTYSSAL